MAHINLLPWREALRKQRQQEFGIAAGIAALFAGAIMLLVHMQVEAMIEQQNNRNRYLQQEIVVLDRQIQEIERLERIKQQLTARMEIIQRLQESRPLAVRMFDEIVRTVPEGVLLESATQTGNNVTVQGRAESNTRVSAFMRNIEASEWIDNPELVVISGDSRGRGATDVLSRFTLRFTVKQVIAEGPSGGAAAPRTGRR